MTLGMMLFGAGGACLVLTVVLIVAFCLHPPKYRPENEAVAMAGGGQTQPLRGGYQTNRLAMSRSLQTAGVQAPSAPVQAPAPGTVPLPAAGAPVPQEPAAAWQGSQAAQPAQPSPGTMVLGAQSYPETVVLGAAQPAPGAVPPGGAPEGAPKAP